MIARQPVSMRRRMLLGAALVLLLFISATAVILDQAFKSSLHVDLQDRLQTQLYLLLGASELINDQLVIPKNLNYPKLNQLDSGSIALVLDDQAESIWRSGSTLGFIGLLKDDIRHALGPGQSRQGEVAIDGERHFYSSLGVAWELNSGQLKNYTFVLAEHSSRLESSLSEYRMYLWVGLVSLAVVLLIVITVTLYWGLSPLNKLAEDLNLIETGKSEQLSGVYPKELIGVVQNLNLLLQHEKRQHTRYRNTLSNLAHSLKTPLAVLRGIVDSEQLGARNINVLADQVSRMDDIVQHQLKRASHVGPQSVQHAIEVMAPVQGLCSVVEKVYQASLQCIDLNIAENVTFRGAKGDLMELVGNLMDNAAKYGGGIVSVYAENTRVSDKILCRIIVEDNGSGISVNDREDILRRGVRADQKQQGQGIGLAMVVDIVDQYQGRIHLSQSEFGGLKVEVVI